MSAVQKLEPINQVVPAHGVATPMEMLASALDKGMAPEVIEKLMNLADRWEASQARKAFDEAIAAAKAEIPPIMKNRTVDFTGKTGIRTHYRHEDLAEVSRTVDPILGKNGLSYRFRATSNVNEPVTVTCILSHRLGHSEETTLTAGRDESGNKNSIQAVGSTITFLQRYTLKVALGLAASNDDDGKAAGGDDMITAEQVGELQSFIVQTGSDIRKFCTWLKVARIEEIAARDFNKAVEPLQRKLAKDGAA